MDGDSYTPELDYQGRDHTPFRGPPEVAKDAEGNPITHFCHRCKLYYKSLYEQGITKEEFPKALSCSWDMRYGRKYLSRDKFASDEDYEFAWATLDPVTFAYSFLGESPEWYQEEFLACSSQFKVFRAGRRIGKSWSLAVYILWAAMTNVGGMVSGRGAQVLIICPYQAQVTLLFDEIRRHANGSAVIRDAVVRNISNPEMMVFSNGAKILGFSAGAKSGAKADKIRGQSADVIAIDELDLIGGKELETIQAILASSKNTRCIAASTPTGVRSKLWNYCTNKDSEWKEFHYISSESPRWTLTVEDGFRREYSAGGYNREFNAEFGEEMAGVFSPKCITTSLRNYDLSKEVYDQSMTYVMGVDWNKTTGTHIVIVGRPRNRAVYRVVEKAIIRRSEYTQMSGVAAVQRLDKKWHCDYVYVDAGYGETQVEMLLNQKDTHWDDGEPIKSFKGRLVAVPMGGKWEIIDPEDQQLKKKDTKPLIVTLSALQVEEGRCEFPLSEDTSTRIVPEELAYSNIGLVQQMRDFKVTKISPQGRPLYSQDYEHTLTAWMLAIFGHLMEYGDYKKRQLTHFGFATGPIGGSSVGAVPNRDGFGQLLTPAQIATAQNMWAERQRDKQADANEDKRSAARDGDLSKAPIVNQKGEYKVTTNGVPVRQSGISKINPRRYLPRGFSTRKTFR